MNGGASSSIPTLPNAAFSSPASLAGSLSSSVENISRPESPSHGKYRRSFPVLVSLAHLDESSTGFTMVNEESAPPLEITDAVDDQQSTVSNSLMPQLPSQMSRSARYEMASLQLVGLCSTMIHKCSTIQTQYADGTDRSYSMHILPIYSEAFRMRIIPLLQAQARLCCDSMRKVRETAFGEMQV